MSFYRIILIVIFNAETSQEGVVMLAGLAQDAGIVSIIGLIALGLAAIPSMHPYKSERGRKVILGYFAGTSMILALVYIFDLIFLKAFDTRISSDVFVLFTNSKEKMWIILNRNVKILPIFLVVIFVGYMWWIILNWLYNVLGMMDRVRQKSIRFQWQSIIVSVFTFFVIASIASSKNVTKMDIKMEKIGTKALIWNPVQTVIES